MTQFNTLAPEKPAATQEQKISTVFRVTVIMLVAAFTVEAFYLFLAFQTGAWQMFALAGVIAVFCLMNIIALPVIKKGHTEAGGWLIIGGMLLVFPGASALIANIGFIFGGALIVLTIVVAGQTLPGLQARAARIAGILVGVLAVIFDYIGLDYRLFVPEIQVFIPAITAIILLVMFIVVIRQSWNKINSSISNRLTALVLIVTIPLLIGITAYISNRAGSEIEAQALLNLQQNNQSFATNISTWLKLQVQTVKEMSTLPDIISMDAARTEPTLKAIANARPNLFLVLSSDLTGMNIARNDDADLINYGDRAWFLSAKQGESVSFDVVISRTIGKPVLAISAPIYNQSEIVGVAAIISELTEISDELLNVEGRRGVTYIVDANNRVVAHPDPTYTEGELRDLSEYPPVATLREGTIGKFTFTDENGILWVAYLTRLENNWGIISQQPEAELLAPVRQFQTVSILFILIGSAVMFALAWYAIRRSLQPIGALITVASAIAAGDLNRVANITSRDEIGVLANTFNLMISQLQNLLATLEERVADRTKALETSFEVSRRLSAATNPRQLAVDVVEQVQAAFGYYHAHIYFLDEQNENLVMEGGTGEAGAAMLASGHKIPRGRGLVGRAAESNQAVLVEDVTQSIGWLPNPLLPDTKSEIAVPISAGEQVLGVLDVQQNIAGGLGKNDVTLLQSLAAQIAISLQNARAYEQSRTRAELESMSNIIGQKIQRAGTVEETLQIAIREMGLALGAARVSVSISAPAPENEENE